MTDTAENPGDRICSFVERIELIDEETKALNKGKRKSSQSQRRVLRRESTK